MDENLNIQVFGERHDAWVKYFQSYFSPSEYDSSISTLKISPDFFTLVHSVFDLDLEVTG